MATEKKKEPRCIDTRQCFAKHNEKGEFDKNGKHI